MHPNDPTTADAASPEQQASPQMWVIAELMGHQRIAGVLTQDTITGLPLVRIDVPAVTYTDSVWRNGAYVDVARTIPPHSRSLAAGAVYAINWVDEAAARLAAAAIKHSPLKHFSLGAALESVPEAERQQLLRLSHGSTLVTAAQEADDDRPF